MKDVVVEEIVKELSKKYNKKEKVIEKMIERSIKIGYNVIESKENIIEFMQHGWQCQLFVNHKENL